MYLAAAWSQRRCSSRMRWYPSRARGAVRGHACKRLPPRPMRAALHALGRLLIWLLADESLEIDCKLRLGEPHSSGCAGARPCRGDRNSRPFGTVGVHQLQLPGQRWMLGGKQVGAAAAELRAVPARRRHPVSADVLSRLWCSDTWKVRHPQGAANLPPPACTASLTEPRCSAASPVELTTRPSAHETCRSPTRSPLARRLASVPPAAIQAGACHWLSLSSLKKG